MANFFGENRDIDFASSKLMSFGKSFSRMNGQPLDESEVWYDLTALKEYAKGNSAYVGMKLVYVDKTNEKVYQYSVQTDGDVKEIGVAPLGDGKTIEVSADGVVSLFGTSKIPTGTYNAVLQDGALTWQEPSATTVEGLDTRLKAAESDITNLKENTYTKEEVDGKISGAFHFKGDAKELKADGNLYDENDNVINGSAGDVYQVGDKEYAYNGETWVELGFTLDTSGFATVTALNNAVQNADTATKKALQDAKDYTDTEVSELEQSLGILALLDTVNEENLGDTLRKEINDKATKAEVNTAKQDAIDAANANTSEKIGEIGDTTVKSYVDGVKTELNSQFTLVNASINGINSTISGYGDIVTHNAGDFASATALANTNSSITSLSATVSANTAAIETKANSADVYTKTAADEKFATITAATSAAQTKADDAYILAEGKTTMAEVEAKGYATTADVTASLAEKQDKIIFNTEYNATTNKAATVTDITNAISGLGNVLHFVGVVESLPSSVEDYKTGDVVIVGSKEYVCDGSKWVELGDESLYVVKGSITNEHIAANANIEKSKLSASAQESLNKADTALQEITAGEGLKITQTGTSIEINFDELILNGGSATDN